MDYEKKYREALERAKHLHKDAIDMGESIRAKQCEIIFPELKESEDERIKEDLIQWINEFPDIIWRGHYKKDVIAWFEKQDEQKLSTIAVDEMVDDYANNKECGNEIFGKPVPCMIRAYRQGLNDAIKKVVLKPTWSEEDERLCSCLIEDQENALDDVRNDKYGHSEIISDLKEMYRERIEWLESLKDRYIWKPSEEQMVALKDINLTGSVSYAGQGQTLIDLYNELKKIKGE